MQMTVQGISTENHTHEWFDAWGWLGFWDQYCLGCPAYRSEIEESPYAYVKWRKAAGK